MRDWCMVSTEAEREESDRLGDLLFPTAEDLERCQQLLAREFAANTAVPYGAAADAGDAGRGGR